MTALVMKKKKKKTKKAMKTISGMISTISKRATRMQGSTTSTMAFRSLQRPRLLLQHRQHRLYNHYHLYVASLNPPRADLESYADLPSQPIPDFDGLDPEDIARTTEPYLNALFPTTAEDAAAPVVSPPKDNPIFLTPRSASLWSQLVAPPPLQPPDWIRSRIRRLFLVSLGVPVDLDEILPASKQKKLVLPSMSSPRTSSDSRRSGSRAPTRLKSPAPGDAGGGGQSASSSSSKRRGAPPPPEFDIVAARQLCATTDEALDGMTDEELGAHVARLQGLEGTAKAVLEYWQQRTDEQVKEREAFEGVIENLVKHARKTRK